MPSPAWENLDDFISTDDFAVLATVTPHGQAAKQIKVIFDDPYLNAQLGEYEWDGGQPRILGKEGDMIGMTRGDSVFVNGKQYWALTNPQQDGTGMAVIHISEQGVDAAEYA